MAIGDTAEAGLAAGALGLGIYFTLRNLQKTATVSALNDNGADQTVDVQITPGETRTKVPVHQQFGISSHPPLDGAVTHVLSVGGDPANMVALPPANPIKGRLGGLKEGETVLYDAVGQRLHLKDGKFIRIDVAEEFQVGFGPDDTVLQVHSGGVKITGELEVSKGLTVKGAASLNDSLTVKRDITTQGDVKSRDVSLQEHTHKTTAAPANGPTTPPIMAGGVTPPEDPDDDPGKKPDKPKEKEPWRDKNGNLIGKAGNRPGVREMPPSEDPSKSASDFVKESKEYLEKQGYVSQGVKMKGRPGKEFESETMRNADGHETTINIRHDNASSDKTGKGTVTVDLHNNPFIEGGNVKFKFPPLNG